MWVILWLVIGARLDAGSEPAQGDYRISQWTTAEGLPQNTVNDILLLPNSELWLATFGGLARFDGHAFMVVDMASDEGLPANRIVSLAPTGAGAVLFLTQQGHLGRIDDGRSTLLAPSIGSAEALEMLVDRNGRIWCRSSDGTAWRIDGARTWQPVSGPSNSGALHDFASSAESREAWAMWGDRLVNMTTGRDESVEWLEREAVVVPRAGGGVWLGLERGIGRYVDGRFERLQVQPALEGKVSAIESGGDGVLWVAITGDVSRLDRQADGSWRRTSLPLRLSSTVGVRTLRLDRQGSLWIGTVGGGLYRVNRLPTRRFGAESGLAGTSALMDDGQGGAFVADGCRRLHHLDATGVARPVRFEEPIDTELTGGCGISLATGPGHRVWARIGSRLFLLQRQGPAAQLITRDVPADEGPIAVNPAGAVWVVSRSGNVRLITPAGRSIREFPLPAPLVSASSAPDGALWIGGDGEVFRVGPESVARFGQAEHVPRGLVRDVLADSDGTVWIGTYGGGLGRLSAGQVVRFTALQGLPDNSVSRILDDGRGRIWISTNRGVAVLDRRELLAVAGGRARVMAPPVFGTERGVPEANFGSPAGFAEASGRLWFGTIDGAVSIDAAGFPFNPTPPAIRIEEIRADDEPLPSGPRVAVPPRTGRLRLRFTAVNQLYPDQMRFRFRVEGRDADWVDAGSERTVDWSPPGPGRHRFLVEARNEDGIWSSAPAEVVLDVLPAWWETAAFRVAGVAGLLLAAVVWVRRRTGAIERRHAERLRALDEQRKAEEQMASLREQLDHVSRAALAGELAASLAHEVGQPIGAIVNNAEAGKRHLSQYLRRPEDLKHIFDDIVADGMRASQVVQGLRGFLQSRGPEAGAIDLSALVREMLPLVRRELQNNRVELELALAEPLPPVEGLRVQLGQIVVNLVVNACEALAHEEGDRRITISTMARDRQVALVVRDNGPGLPADVAARVFEPFVTTKAEGLGVGLAICRSIAERHGGHLRADAVAGGGLEVTLTLPATSEAASES
jgi:signal transduction histidine kinase/streptogramin lyase